MHRTKSIQFKLSFRTQKTQSLKMVEKALFFQDEQMDMEFENNENNENEDKKMIINPRQIEKLNNFKNISNHLKFNGQSSFCNKQSDLKIRKQPSITDPRKIEEISFNEDQQNLFKPIDFSKIESQDDSQICFPKRLDEFSFLTKNLFRQDSAKQNQQKDILQEIKNKKQDIQSYFDPQPTDSNSNTPVKTLKRPFKQLNNIMLQKTAFQAKSCFSEPRKIDFKTPAKEQSRFFQKINFGSPLEKMDLEKNTKNPQTPTKSMNKSPALHNIFQDMLLSTPNKDQPQQQDIYNSPPPSKTNRSLSRRNPPQTDMKINNQMLNEDAEEEFILHQNYDILETIGDGCFGTVYRCQNKIDGQIYAVKRSKQFIQGDLSKKAMLKEARALAKLSATSENQYVVRYFKAWIDCNQLYMVMEYCKNSLKNQMKSFPQGMSEIQIKKIMTDVLNGLDHIHQKKFAHLDIKPDNILLSNSGNYKIADFGLSRLAKVKRGEQLDEGDSMYLAVEMLNPNEYTDLTRVDIFSLGISIYQLMINTKLPQNGPAWHQIRYGSLLDTFENSSFSPELKKIVRQMMSIDPNQRKSAHEILQDPYLKDELQHKLLWHKREQKLLQQKLEFLESQEQFLKQIKRKKSL